ncbi:hypothetical protein K431DRAFT_325169 [Polychaeton citri CBS 116435]|uniref:Zn(2)-C6 fungal-type domain-containing protein n=1 Tax=Polychaeton citri CBS 116435 TaxID=1314669 RepID=A0A9P4UPQ1_9PEZI|nr:hypothetical protein K431DRAFT_325169 [Polychaeton citri CBS 116435]
MQCDHTRPSCGYCQRANLTCEYDTEDPGESRLQALNRQHGDLQTLQNNVRSSLAWLSSQTPEIAVSYLQRLQRVNDPVHELCSMVAVERAQRLPATVSTHDALITGSPSINSALELELTISYPRSYPPLLKAGPISWKESPARQHNPGQSDAANSSIDPEESRLTSHVGSRGSATRPRGVPTARLGVLSDPAPPQPDTCESRLSSLKIGFWTTVKIANELAASLISLYLQIEHPVYGFFDSELFIQDLLAHEVRYCSPLLVNSILFWASCTFDPLHPAASVHSGAFLKLAQMLLKAEANSNTLSTICFGEDRRAKQYMVAGIRMGEQLHLIGEDRHNAGQFGDLSVDKLSMLTYVAWGAFNFSTVLTLLGVYTLHFHDIQSGTYTPCPPLLPKPHPKASSTEEPVPGGAPSTDTSYQGTTFPFFCGFWCIAHEVVSVYYSVTGPLHEQVPLAFAEAKLRSLLEWAESLPPDMARSNGMAHNVAEMHICYHATIMDLFRPYLAQMNILSTFSTSPRRPEAIFMLSFTHLKDLTHYYHSSYAGLAASHTISWVHGPLYVAPAILHYQKRESWKIEFLPYLSACSDLFQAHKVMEGFLKALLGMAVFAGAISMMQANEFLENLRAKRQDRRTFEVLETGFVVDQDLAMETRAAAIGDVLAQRFDEMLFFEDVLDTEPT